MVSCAVASCKNSSRKTTKCRGGITFHRFPQDMARRKKWEIAVNRTPEWAPTDSSTVCSEHFEVNNFYFTECGRRKLVVDAVPTLNISPLDDTKPTISSESVKPDYLTPADSEEVIRLKHRIRHLEVVARNRRKQMQLLYQSKIRMQKKIDEMKCVIENLIQAKEKNKCDENKEDD